MAGYVKGKPGGGASVKNEKSIISALYDMTHNYPKSYYICWKYAPEALPQKGIKTYDELKNAYSFFSKGMTEEVAKGWELENTVQSAIKYLLKRLHQQKMIELYNLYFEKARDDVASFKAFTTFSESFFQSEKESELYSILHGIDFSDDEDSEDEDE